MQIMLRGPKASYNAQVVCFLVVLEGELCLRSDFV